LPDAHQNSATRNRRGTIRMTFIRLARGRETKMCPACLATLAMMVAGATSTGGVAAVLLHKFRAKTGAKKVVEDGKGEWTQRRKSHEQEDGR
jgi:hypothetical protein